MVNRPKHWYQSDIADCETMVKSPMCSVFDIVHDYAVWLDEMLDKFGVGSDLDVYAFVGPNMHYARNMEHVELKPDPTGPLNHASVLNNQAVMWLNKYKGRSNAA